MSDVEQITLQCQVCKDFAKAKHGRMINLWYNLKGIHFKNHHNVSEALATQYPFTVKSLGHIDCRYMTYISHMDYVLYRFNKENYF